VETSKLILIEVIIVNEEFRMAKLNDEEGYKKVFQFNKYSVIEIRI
jgi:hypothetical protein